MHRYVRSLTAASFITLLSVGCLPVQPRQVDTVSPDAQSVVENHQAPVLTYETDFKNNNLVVKVTAPHDDLEIVSWAVGIQHAGSKAWSPALDFGDDPVIYRNLAKGLHIVGLWEWQDTDYWYLVLEVRRVGQTEHFKLEVHRGPGQ